MEKDVIVSFIGMEETVSNEILFDSIFDITFGGSMMVMFERKHDGKVTPINAVNGYGHNCYNEIKDEVLTIKET